MLSVAGHSGASIRCGSVHEWGFRLSRLQKHLSRGTAQVTGCQHLVPCPLSLACCSFENLPCQASMRALHPTLMPSCRWTLLSIDNLPPRLLVCPSSWDSVTWCPIHSLVAAVFTHLFVIRCVMARKAAMASDKDYHKQSGAPPARSDSDLQARHIWGCPWCLCHPAGAGC